MRSNSLRMLPSHSACHSTRHSSAVVPEADRGWSSVKSCCIFSFSCSTIIGGSVVTGIVYPTPVRLVLSGSCVALAEGLAGGSLGSAPRCWPDGCVLLSSAAGAPLVLLSSLPVFTRSLSSAVYTPVEASYSNSLLFMEPMMPTVAISTVTNK